MLAKKTETKFHNSRHRGNVMKLPCQQDKSCVQGISPGSRFLSDQSTPPTLNNKTFKASPHYAVPLTDLFHFKGPSNTSRTRRSCGAAGQISSGNCGPIFPATQPRFNLIPNASLPHLKPSWKIKMFIRAAICTAATILMGFMSGY